MVSESDSDEIYSGLLSVAKKRLGNPGKAILVLFFCHFFGFI